MPLRAPLETRTFSLPRTRQRFSTNGDPGELPYCDNRVSTARYSIWTFLPKNLFEQFSRFANMYFLGISILQLIPGLSPTGRFTTLLPLSFVLAVTAIKDAYEDYWRHVRDREQNEKTCFVLRDGQFLSLEWKSILVGDVVKLVSNEDIPADILLLSCPSADSVAYVETSGLDGETNLKVKRPVNLTRSIGVESSPYESLYLSVTSEVPNSSIHTFVGSVNTKKDGRNRSKDSCGVRIENVLLRGSTLRNTEEIIGVVVATGHETKIMKNASDPKHKVSNVEKLTNRFVVFLFTFLFFLCLVCAILHALRLENMKNLFWYLYVYSNPRDGAASGSVAFFTFLILYNNLIPISLYVSMEMVKFVQGYLINNDPLMTHTWIDDGGLPRVTRAEARTTSLNEELGQVEYVFSDKTGTLTCNMMSFLKCSIGNQVYGHGITEIGEARRQRHNLSPYVDPRPLHVTKSKFSFWDPRLLDASWLHQPNASEIRHFFSVLAVCHDVIPQWRDPSNMIFPHASSGESIHPHPPRSPKDIVFKCSSPDEEALVQACANLGFVFFHRDPRHVFVYVSAEDRVLQYEVLNVNEFSSDRKRQSVVVRNQDGEIWLYCKGADSMIKELLEASEIGINSFVDLERNIEQFAEEGLRTLVIAERRISADEYAVWADLYHAANTFVGRDYAEREAKLAEVAAQIERDLLVVGATGIEDRLQDGVPDTIKSLHEAGMKIIMLTGDKQETAINIGYSCSLLDEKMTRLEFPEGLNDDTDGYLTFTSTLCDHLYTIRSQFGVEERDSKSQILDRFGFISHGEEDEDVENSRRGGSEIANVPSLKRFLSSQGRPNTASAPTSLKFSSRKTFHLADDDKILPYSVILDGYALKIALEPENETRFLNLVRRASAVICCRVSPKQKESIVKLYRDRLQKITLAIGDGGNDVSMIRAADVGIGISGNEGLQAARSSDYSIGQFRFLRNLLLVHGRMSYRRISKLLLYSFYKNTALYIGQFYFFLFNSYSGTTLYDIWILATYNMIFTSFPIVFYAVLDRDVSVEESLARPSLYLHSQKNGHYSVLSFVGNFMNACIHSAIAFFFVSYAYEWSVSSDMLSTNISVVGTTVYTSIVFLVTLKLCLETCSFTLPFVLMTSISVGSYFLFIYLLSIMFKTGYSTFAPMYGVWDFTLGSGYNWLVVIGVLVTCLMRDFAWKGFVVQSRILSKWYSPKGTFLELASEPHFFEHDETAPLFSSTNYSYATAEMETHTVSQQPSFAYTASDRGIQNIHHADTNPQTGERVHRITSFSVEDNSSMQRAHEVLDGGRSETSFASAIGPRQRGGSREWDEE